MDSTINPAQPISSRTYWLVLLLIVAAAGFVRFYPSAKFQGSGYDEVVYDRYVSYLEQMSLLDFPEICEHYLKVQKEKKEAILPPTRFLYPYAAHLCQGVTGGTSRHALVLTSALFSTLVVLVSAGFARSIGGSGIALAVAGLMATGVNQIHQSQHAMVDGFFTFWCVLALWSLWEMLQGSSRRVWQILYPVSMAAMVMTKETSFFVAVAVCGLIVANRWLRFGTVTPRILALTVAGPLVGFLILVMLAGGLGTFIEMYRLLVQVSSVLPWAIQNGDGPWYRYLIDLIIISPVVTLFAVGRAFQLRLPDKASLYLLLFVLITFAMLASVKYGMNIRYAIIWDLPLRFLAASQIFAFGERFGRRGQVGAVVGIVLLCGLELYHYYVFCVAYGAYALVAQELLHAVKILKLQ